MPFAVDTPIALRELSPNSLSEALTLAHIAAGRDDSGGAILPQLIGDVASEDAISAQNHDCFARHRILSLPLARLPLRPRFAQ